MDQNGVTIIELLLFGVIESSLCPGLGSGCRLDGGEKANNNYHFKTGNSYSTRRLDHSEMKDPSNRLQRNRSSCLKIPCTSKTT
jgi:hypothetical protein